MVFLMLMEFSEQMNDVSLTEKTFSLARHNLTARSSVIEIKLELRQTLISYLLMIYQTTDFFWIILDDK